MLERWGTLSSKKGSPRPLLKNFSLESDYLDAGVDLVYPVDVDQQGG